MDITASGEFYRKIRGRAMIETTVLGGFPVLAVARINSAEPDVGYDSIWVDDTDLELFTLRGKPAPFIEKKMTKDDWAYVVEALLESCSHSY